MAPTSKIVDRASIGRRGEQQAESYLRRRGLTIVMRNYRCGLGEVDLIMRDGETLVFVEVRQRKTADFGSPLETVSLHKQRKVSAAAQHYLTTQQVSSRQAIRFDVVGIVGEGEAPAIDWVRNAF